MNINSFAVKHKLSIKRDLDGTFIIHGRVGDLYEYDQEELGVIFLNLTLKKWGSIRRQCQSAGMIIRQNGDSEGALSFDPSNAAQARLAIRLAKARPKRRLSPEHLAKLLVASQAKRFATTNTVLNP